MSTLAFKFEEIKPRELRPEVYDSTGSPAASVEAHYKLYQGYVNKRNEILGKLADVDLSAANQVYSELRALKVDLTFAIGGIRTTSSTSAPRRRQAAIRPAFGALVKRDFGSVDAWRTDLKATASRGAGWAWTAYDWDEGHLFNYIGDAQNTFRSGTRRRSSHSTSTSMRISSTIRPTAPRTSTRSSTTSTGTS